VVLFADEEVGRHVAGMGVGWEVRKAYKISVAKREEDKQIWITGNI
jgi:hypothetical protein